MTTTHLLRSAVGVETRTVYRRWTNPGARPDGRARGIQIPISFAGAKANAVRPRVAARRKIRGPYCAGVSPVKYARTYAFSAPPFEPPPQAASTAPARPSASIRDVLKTMAGFSSDLTISIRRQSLRASSARACTNGARLGGLTRTGRLCAVNVSANGDGHSRPDRSPRRSFIFRVHSRAVGFDRRKRSLVKELCAVSRLPARRARYRESQGAPLCEAAE